MLRKDLGRALGVYVTQQWSMFISCTLPSIFVTNICRAEGWEQESQLEGYHRGCQLVHRQTVPAPKESP